MTRISRTISDISVICCFFYCQRMTLITRIFLCILCLLLFIEPQTTQKDAKLYMIVAVVISYFCAFCVFCGFPHQRISRILVSFLHMFGNKLLSPESKTYELLQLTNNHGHYITFTYQKSKNPLKITTTIYIFRQFSFLPIFKNPRP